MITTAKGQNIDVHSKVGGKIISTFGDVKIIRNTKDGIAQEWERLADEAEKLGDKVLAESYRQQAEHWRRVWGCEK